MLPTYTTNITGFRTWTPGVSFRNESMMARRRMGPSKSGRDFECVGMFRLSSLGGRHDEMLDDRSQRQRGNERERSNEHHHPDQQRDEERRVSRQGARTRRDRLLASQRARDRK